MSVGTITWGELGCPIEPCTVTVRNMTFRIENRHIEAAQGEPEATFLIIEAATLSNGKHYTLGIRLD